MKKCITINDVLFEICKSKNDPIVRSFTHRSIFECYDNPSSIKVNIYNEWRNWFINIDRSIDNGVTSYNCMRFTYSGYINDLNTPIGVIDVVAINITACHNRVIVPNYIYKRLVDYSKYNDIIIDTNELPWYK